MGKVRFCWLLSKINGWYLTLLNSSNSNIKMALCGFKFSVLAYVIGKKSKKRTHLYNFSIPREIIIKCRIINSFGTIL